MKALLLSDATSSHTIKWANGLASKGIDICLFSLREYNGNEYDKKINVLSSNLFKKVINKSEGNLYKTAYLRALPQIQKIIKKFQPDLVHAHYISSYGILGVMSSYHPLIVSVWGSDIYDFPQRSFLHKLIVKHILSRADVILSTSKTMGKETQKYSPKKITITPFGVDIQKFKTLKTKRVVFSENDLVIGTIKTLDRNYGIDVLLKAFKIAKDNLASHSLKLLIVGDGPLKNEYETLAKSLNISHDTAFVGKIPFDEIPTYHNNLDIYVALSLSESFGVAVIEASACEKPVVVTNIGGLPEVVENNETGFVVEPGNEFTAAEAIEKLVLNAEMRINFGKNGRKNVMEKYNWDENLESMVAIYNQCLM